MKEQGPSKMRGEPAWVRSTLFQIEHTRMKVSGCERATHYVYPHSTYTIVRLALQTGTPPLYFPACTGKYTN